MVRNYSAVHHSGCDKVSCHFGTYHAATITLLAGINKGEDKSFLHGCHENNVVVQFQLLHFKLAHDITCIGTCCGYINVFKHLSDTRAHN